jgi:hypothetical protein
MYAPKRATLSKKQQQRKRAQAAETPPPPPSNKAFKRGQNGRAKVVPLTAALPANSSRQGWAQVIEKELVDAAGTVFCQIKWKGKVPRSILPEEDVLERPELARLAREWRRDKRFLPPASRSTMSASRSTMPATGLTMKVRPRRATAQRGGGRACKKGPKGGKGGWRGGGRPKKDTAALPPPAAAAAASGPVAPGAFAQHVRCRDRGCADASCAPPARKQPQAEVQSDWTCEVREENVLPARAATHEHATRPAPEPVKMFANSPSVTPRAPPPGTNTSCAPALGTTAAVPGACRNARVARSGSRSRCATGACGEPRSVSSSPTTCSSAARR